jgi:hypothetical protein
MKLALKNVRLPRWTWIGMIVVGVALLVWLVLVLLGVFDPPTRVGEKKIDPNRCPACNAPLSPFAKEKGECLLCHADLPGARKTAAQQVANKYVPAVLIGVFSILLVVNVALAVRAWARQNQPEVIYHMNCGKCGRKIRYRPKQIGQCAQCPLCRKWVRFAEPPPEEPKGMWVTLKRWLRKKPRKKKPAPQPEEA